MIKYLYCNVKIPGTTNLDIAKHHATNSKFICFHKDNKKYYSPLINRTLIKEGGGRDVKVKVDNDIYYLMKGYMQIILDGYSDYKSVQNVNTYGTHYEFGLHLDSILIFPALKGLYKDTVICLDMNQYANNSTNYEKTISTMEFTIPKGVSSINVNKFFGIPASNASSKRFYNMSVRYKWDSILGPRSDHVFSYWSSYSSFSRKYDTSCALSYYPLEDDE